MDVEIDLNKLVDENARIYYDLARRSKKKLEGAKDAIEDTKKKLAIVQKQEAAFWEEEEKKQVKKERKREWFEKFHWFTSSNGYLCVGGKDATSNEIVIKKHMEKEDIVFHTEAPGSPFFLVKNGLNAPATTLDETAQAVAIYSKAWKFGHTVAEVFYVNPEQVTKEAKSGEYISKGSFMVYGKKNFLHPKVECAIGSVEGRTIGGPVNAIKKQTTNYVIILPGEEKKSSLAKKIVHKLKGGEMDEVMAFLPAGEGRLEK